MFAFSFVVNLVVDAVVGQRVSAKAELEGLDLPEMGQLGYPEFELKARPVGRSNMTGELDRKAGSRTAAAGSLARPSHGLARRTGGVYPDARSGLRARIRARRTCALAWAWRTP